MYVSVRHNNDVENFLLKQSVLSTIATLQPQNVFHVEHPYRSRSGWIKLLANDQHTAVITCHN